MAEKRLTKEIAEQFLADTYSVDLREFTELDDDAADMLRSHEWDLYLNGLTSLSDAAAESLCELELGCLCLDHFGFITSAGKSLWPHVLHNMRAYYE